MNKTKRTVTVTSEEVEYVISYDELAQILRRELNETGRVSCGGYQSPTIRGVIFKVSREIESASSV
jgi:hypothetical protein